MRTFFTIVIGPLEASKEVFLVGGYFCAKTPQKSLLRIFRLYLLKVSPP